MSTVTADQRATDAPRRRLPILALFAAQFFSLGGNAIALIAIPIIALIETGSPLAAGEIGRASCRERVL